MASKQPKAGARMKVPTPDQLRAREEMRTLAAAWNSLTEEQREAWCVASRADRRGSRAARARRRTGRGLFFKVNSRRLALKQGLLADPPDAGNYYPTPRVRLVITNHAGHVSLKVYLAHDRAEGVMVSSWRPCNPGAMVWDKFVRLELLQAPHRGMCDITRPYVAKFGVPPVGTKVFIRVQQMNDYAGSVFYTTSSVVPEEED
jgi:hypothetical protein